MKRLFITLAVSAVVVGLTAQAARPRLRVTRPGRLLPTASTSTAGPVISVTPDHVVIVIMENHSFSAIIGSPNAPNINALAAEGALIVADPGDPQANRSGSHAVRHPSQPNYLELFSGSNQGTLQDGYPGSSSEPLASPPPFSTPNLAAQLLQAGYTFATYSEDLPAVGSDVASNGAYQRKHNPVSNWQADDAPANNHVPRSTNQPFFPLPGQPNTGFPSSNFSQLPAVSIVVPNQNNDMHDGTVAQGDAWVKSNIIDTYYQWAKTHNSLLILTFDEDGTDTPSNQIATIFAGPMVKPGNYTERDLNISNPYIATTGPGIQTPTGTAMNHWNVLATVEELYGLAHIGNAVNRPPVTDVFLSPLITKPLVAPNQFAGQQGDTGNLFPLFSSKPIRYQQVYAASQFSRFAAGGEDITSIAFRARLPGLPFTGTVPQLQVNLSTTAKAPDNLSSDFSSNVGPNDTQVFSGPLNVVATDTGSADGPTTFDIVITFTTPFHYDPAQGNLLVDVRNLQGGTEVPPLDQELDGALAAGDSVSRAYNYGDASAAAASQLDTYGLITQFGTATSPAATPVHLTKVVSEKMHGSQAFDVELALGGQPTVECRYGGTTGDYTLIFTFGDTLTQVDSAAVSSGTGRVSSSAIDPNDAHRYIVNLTGVTNAQYVTVTLTNVRDSAGDSSSMVSASFGLLLGDTNGDGSVNSADITQTKSQSGQPLSTANFREDLNCDGAINSADISLVKSQSGTGLR